MSFSSLRLMDAIQQAVGRLGEEATLDGLDDAVSAGPLNRQIRDRLHGADLVIADVTGSTPNTMYELGLATAISKPIVVMVNSATDVPFDLAGLRFLTYDDSDSTEDLADLIYGFARKVISDPEWIRRDATGGPPSAFISYAHTDAAFLDRLMVHLRPLQHAGVLDVWSDRQLKAGDRWKEEIERALNRASVAILLVSADFLASDFIVENELPPLLRAAQSEGTTIVPVILKPCRFTRDPNLSAFQAANDPKSPLAGLSEIEREAMYDSVAATVERLIAV